MIPIKDVIPPRTPPKITLTLLIVAMLLLPLQYWTGQLAAMGLAYGLLNVLYLWIFADNVEDRLGQARFLWLCLSCYFAGTAARMMVDSEWRLVASLTSGVAAGVTGAYFVLYPKSRILTWMPFALDLHEIPAMFFLTTFFVLQVPAGVGTLAEAGAGFLAGAALCVLLRRPIVW